MKPQSLNIIRFIVGVLLLACVIDLPHLLFGFDLLSICSVFSFLLLGFALFYWNITVFKILLVLYCVLVPVLCLQYFWARTELGEGLWHIVLATNKREVVELVRPKIGLIVLAIILAFLVGRFICSRCFPAKIQIRLAIKMGLVGTLGIIISTVILANRTYRNNVILGFKGLQPFAYPSTLLYVIKRNRNMGDFVQIRENYRFGAATMDSTLSNRKNIVVLIIGEASRYDHWSINGYYRNTTPLLKLEQNLFSFRNMASPASGTIFSVPLIMTAGDPYHYEAHYRYKGIIDAFKEGGYRTVYITNQEEKKTDNFANEFHYQSVDSFYNTADYLKAPLLLKSLHDEAVLPILQKVLQETSVKDHVFVCIHLLGSHNDYKKRYPDRFNVFKPDSNINLKNKYGYDEQIAYYDNSILYTDFVLSRILDVLKDIDGYTSMLYTSDHGENLMDDDNKLVYHGAQPYKFLIHIPYLIWMNDKLKNTKPEYDSLLKKYWDYPLSAGDNTLFTLLQLGNLYPQNESKRFKYQSILSDSLQYSEQKVYAPFKQELKYSDLLKK